VIDQGKRDVLGVRVDVVDYEGAVARIIAAAEAGRSLTASALAVHGLMTGVLDRVHRHRLNALDLVTPDGQPVRWALNLLHGAGLRERVYGPTLMLEICSQAGERGLSVYLYGSRPPVLEALRRALEDRFPDLRVAGARPSLFRRTTADEKAAIIEEIRSSGAAIVFVGLGCPRQEVFAYEYRELSVPVVAVGAAFDFHAGSLTQAPSWMQRSGLEWLHRLLHEPARLWKRYVLLNPTYLVLLCLQRVGLAHFDPDDTVTPDEELRYG
jgi:exopolysaccharide biosynthesis WecB/TagA/CpsF family protein